MQHSHWLYGSVLLVAASACGIDVQYVPTNTPPHAMRPRSAQRVEVFASARPKREFTEFGLIEVQQESQNHDDAEEIIARLREEAGERGCDGIVMLGANDGTAVSGMVDKNGGWVSGRS